jgi:hypothetical protein
MAQVLEAAGDFTTAESVFGQAAEVYSKIYGKSNWRTKQVYSALAEMFAHQGRDEEVTALKAKYKLRH